MVPRLFGPFKLTVDRLDKHLQASSPGIFALGEERHGVFTIKQIGRSDDDLRLALKSHIRGPHKYFKFSYAMSPEDAFAKECELYHSLIALDQPTHPAPPNSKDLKCARCGYEWRDHSDSVHG
jgi:hypothetical protein